MPLVAAVTASTTIPYLVRHVVVSNLEQWLGLKEDLVVEWDLPERMWPEKDSDHIRVAVECFDGQGDKLGFIYEPVNPTETQYTVPRWNKPHGAVFATIRVETVSEKRLGNYGLPEDQGYLHKLNIHFVRLWGDEYHEFVFTINRVHH